MSELSKKAEKTHFFIIKCNKAGETIQTQFVILRFFSLYLIRFFLPKALEIVSERLSFKEN